MEDQSNSVFQFSKDNYLWLVIGIAVIFIGYALMAGGKPESPAEFNPEVFSFRRVYVAPVVSLIGFIVVFFAIMKKPKPDA